MHGARLQLDVATSLAPMDASGKFPFTGEVPRKTRLPAVPGSAQQ